MVKRKLFESLQVKPQCAKALQVTYRSSYWCLHVDLWWDLFFSRTFSKRSSQINTNSTMHWTCVGMNMGFRVIPWNYGRYTRMVGKDWSQFSKRRSHNGTGGIFTTCFQISQKKDYLTHTVGFLMIGKVWQWLPIRRHCSYFGKLLL